ncbi:DUF2788 domain-containing protein [Endozoicomonadaceae bacterium StTr2]
MDVEEFETLMLQIFVPGLILFMAFIVYDLARKSKAGKFGTFVLFGTLCLGVLAFVIKSVVVSSIGGY